MKKKAKKGFTLIELMITVVILVIISSVGYVTYSNSIKVSRDARRKQDLKQIQTSLEVYFQANGHYPTYVEVNCASHINDRSCTITHDWEYSTWAPCPPDWIYENTGGGCVRQLNDNSSSPVDPINDGPLNADNGYIYYY